VGKYEQLGKVKDYRRQKPDAGQLHSHILQVVVADVDRSFQAFFRRVKAGGDTRLPGVCGKVPAKETRHFPTLLHHTGWIHLRGNKSCAFDLFPGDFDPSFAFSQIILSGLAGLPHPSSQ